MLISLIAAVALFACAQADSVCPDEKQQCDGDHSCCRLVTEIAGSEWGCCPFANGVCCDDRSTCCPADHLCVPGKRACVPNVPVVTSVKMGASLEPSVAVGEREHEQPLKPRNNLLGRVTGNVHRFEMPPPAKTDKTRESEPLKQSKPRKTETATAKASCSAAETACGASSCCPLPDAVCCANGVHCCPSSTSCDLTQARCVAGSGVSALLLPLYAQVSMEKSTDNKLPVPEKKLLVDDVVCPDGSSSCPDGTTCCQLSSGQYGCCPLPNAVCCEDKLHCCPQNSKCDVPHSRCIQSDGASYSWFAKFASSASSRKEVEDVKVKDVVCPDQQSSCPDGTTCCQLESGQYGCCPLPNAVCCEDKLHCCPQNSKCDVPHSRCIQSDGTYTSLLKKSAARR